ncbi:MAG: DNA alkylation repair protein [Candidatus Coatesbacteria bacterium]|nr:DNA alkylation repair protein [Candidatus Coatesbacteria bacterium]
MGNRINHDEIINKIKLDIASYTKPEDSMDYQRFFKEKLKQPRILKSKIIGKISNASFRQIKDASKEEIFDICEKLLSNKTNEESFIAFNWAYRKKDDLKEDDIRVFERWINVYVDNWAYCDSLCCGPVGFLIFENEQLIKVLLEWTKSRNKWFRRASAVSLIYSIQKERYLKEAFKIAEILLQDREDMVQKGYGWMLKEAGKHYEDEVYSFVLARKKTMPRTALRYAIEKMPVWRKIQVMKRDR